MKLHTARIHDAKGAWRWAEEGAALISTKRQIAAHTGASLCTNVAGGDVDVGVAEEIVTTPGPAPAEPSRVIACEWAPPVGGNPGNQLSPLGPDDFLFQPGIAYGGNAAVGAST